MIRIKRIRHATFATPDIEAQIEYLSVDHRARRRRKAGRLASSSPRNRKNSRSSSRKKRSPVARPWPSRSVPRPTFEFCASSSRIPRNQRPIFAPTVCPEYRRRWFSTTSTGARSSCSRNGNSPHAGEQVRGIVVNKLGHMALYAPDPDRTAKFFEDVLGFRVSDRIERKFRLHAVRLRPSRHEFRTRSRGSRSITWRSNCGTPPTCSRPAICSDAGRSTLLWGPVRHGPGHNIATYHRNPDGYLVELYYDMDRMVDEELGYFEPRPWHRDRPQRPKTWIGLPRDVWGVGPAPGSAEFSPTMRGMT